MTYLVTGATGGLGGYALNYLKELVPMSDIYALVRSKEKGADLKAQDLTSELVIIVMQNQ